MTEFDTGAPLTTLRGEVGGDGRGGGVGETALAPLPDDEGVGGSFSLDTFRA